MNKIVFSGSYADLRFVKTRKVAAITIEIPIEAATAFIEAFGAPDPSKECPVAIARLEPNKNSLAEARQVQPKARKSWTDLPLSQQASIRCGELGFQKFIEAENEEKAAQFVRNHCRVESRKFLDSVRSGAALWKALEDSYQCHARGYDGMIR